MNFDKILIIQTAFLGDVILITPLIRATRELFPDATLDVLVIPETKNVLENNPNIQKIIIFDKRRNKFTAFFKTVKALRNNRYDLAISPHSSITTAYLMVFAGIKERLGFNRFHAARYLTLEVPHVENSLTIRKNLHLLSVFANDKFDIQTEIFPNQQQLENADRILKEGNFQDRPTIALAPGSVWDTKRWHESHYATLAAMLFEQKFNLIFIGAIEERKLCEGIIQTSGIKAVNLAGKASILESAAVIGKCALMICNDNGAMHIANAMKTDVFAFFGPTVKSFGFFPFQENDEVFENVPWDITCV